MVFSSTCVFILFCALGRGILFSLQDRSHTANTGLEWPEIPCLFVIRCVCVSMAMFNTTSHNLIYLHLLLYYHQTEITPAVVCIHLFLSPNMPLLYYKLCAYLLGIFFPLHLYIDTTNHLVNFELLYILKQLCYEEGRIYSSSEHKLWTQTIWVHSSMFQLCDSE